MKKAGFTMIELVFVVVILGVLSAVAVPRFLLSREDACYAKLRADLSETQTVLTREYTKRFMQGKSLTNDELRDILKSTLISNSSDRCEFQYVDTTKVNALVNKNLLSFHIQTDSITKSPTITCDLQNDMCKRLTGKKTTN
ncbi:MAG: type II secretion system GspH family protein [Helicobacteraceae bacterium]|nr:type II secretion system GspH family protein [Helicobacteraceae bacterium]